MPFLSREFIAVPDERKNQILFKWPDDQLRKGTRCIVEPDMLAVFINKGEVVGTLGPGRHQVEADEIPGLGAVIDAVTGGNAYRAELYFVGTHEYVSQKFGGRIDDIQDPQSQLLVGMRVFGDYSVRVTDPAKLILQLTGTVDVADNDAVTGWIGEQLLKAMRQLVAKNVITGTWPVVSTAAFSSEIETGSLTAGQQRRRRLRPAADPAGQLRHLAGARGRGQAQAARRGHPPLAAGRRVRPDGAGRDDARRRSGSGAGWWQRRGLHRPGRQHRASRR